ncbi:MAG: glycosyltransferase [Aliiglaciecola sp.]
MQLETFCLVDSNEQESFDSVIAMAVYSQDRLDWVSDALQSLVDQTYKRLLIVVIIDGHIEHTLTEHLERTAKEQSNILLLKNAKNVGLSASMNAVVDYVDKYQPKYFFRMDADDISQPDRVFKQVNYFEAHPKISILGSALVEINEQGKKVGNRKLPLKHGEIVKFLPKRCSINHPTVGLRYQIFLDGHKYNELLANTQDYFFWIDLAHKGYKFANLPDKLLKFRRVNDFYKRRGLTKSINEFKARFYAMQKLNKYSLGNLIYAFSVLVLRLMPSGLIKLAYKVDRYLLNKRFRH